MRLALLTTDNREAFREYHKTAPWFGMAPESLLQGMEQLAELEVHVISCTQKPMPSPEKLAPNIWFHSLLVPKIGWLRTGYQGCIRTVRRKLQELQPDLVHGQGTERDCALSAVYSGFPNLLTIHGNMRLIAQVHRARPFSFAWIAARLERFTIPRSLGVVCITRYTRDAVAALAKRTWVVPNAAETSFFKLEPRPAPDREPLILCVGHVDLRKNQNAFIRALDPLAARTKFKVLFLGRTDPGDAYGGEFLQLLSARPWCAHAGFADRSKLQGHLREASLLVLPSLEDNCPMVVLEAMASGVPVLAARVGGVPDLFEDEKSGLFCDPLEAASMENGVSRLLADRELARRLAAAAKARASEHFYPPVIARQHLEIYREVLRPGSRSR